MKRTKMLRLRIVGGTGAIILMIMLVLAACKSTGTMLLSTPTATAQPTSPFPLWVVDGMARVGQTDASGTETAATIAAAQNETEPFQIVVQAPTTALTITSVEVSNLHGPNKAVIATSNLTLYREHYVGVTIDNNDWPTGPNLSLGSGVYADALIPFIDPATGEVPQPALIRAVPFTLAAGQNQPFWVDVAVPASAVPGDYTGTFTVATNLGTASGQIALTVWDFALPRVSSMVSSFNIYSPKGPIRDAIEDMLFDHRLTPQDITPSKAKVLADAGVLHAAHLHMSSGADISHCVMKPAPSVADIRAEAQQYPSNVLLYNRSADLEGQCANLYDDVKAWARNLHAAGVKQAITMPPTPELYDDGTGKPAVDIWIMLPKMYVAANDQISAAQQAGGLLWSYSALEQDNYSPKWQIDFAPLNYRMQQGFISQSLGLTGVLYWSVDQWTSDPWNNVMTYNNGQHWFAGEGMLVYPGAQVGVQGVVPSMRLKWLREGMDDYDYVELLKQGGHTDEALAIISGVGADWMNWSKDPEAVQAVRAQLGQKLSDLTEHSTLTPTSFLPLIGNSPL